MHKTYVKNKQKKVGGADSQEANTFLQSQIRKQATKKFSDGSTNKDEGLKSIGVQFQLQKQLKQFYFEKKKSLKPQNNLINLMGKSFKGLIDTKMQELE